MSNREHNSMIEHVDPTTNVPHTFKQFDATTRQLAALSRTPEEQLDRLNARLGAGVGAKKERERLLSQLAATA